MSQKVPISINLDPAVHAWVEEQSKKDGRSKSNFVAELIRREYEARKKEK